MTVNNRTGHWRIAVAAALSSAAGAALADERSSGGPDDLHNDVTTMRTIKVTDDAPDATTEHSGGSYTTPALSIGKTPQSTTARPCRDCVRRA